MGTLEHELKALNKKMGKQIKLSEKIDEKSEEMSLIMKGHLNPNNRML